MIKYSPIRYTAPLSALILIASLGCAGSKHEQAPAIASFNATPAVIELGGKSVLAWTASDADSLTIDNGVGIVTGKTSIEVTPKATTAYILTAKNNKGSVTSTTTVTLSKPTIVGFATSIPAVDLGGKATLTWAAKGAASVTIDNNIGDVTGKTSLDVVPTKTTTYKITATNASGDTTSEATVTLNKPTIVGFAPSTPAVDLGGKATLTWAAKGAASVTIDNNIGDVTGKTSLDVVPTKTTTYKITATNASGDATSEATVTLNKPTIVGFAASVSNLGLGAKAQLTWNVSGAEKVSIDNGIDDVTGKTSVDVTPEETSTYTLTATNGSGTATMQVTITVDSFATATFTATPNWIRLGETSTLAWDIPKATQISIDNAIGDVTGKTSYQVTPTASKTTYVLTAKCGKITQTKTVDVFVAAPVLTYADPATPQDDEFLIIRNAASTPDRLVLDLVGPATSLPARGVGLDLRLLSPSFFIWDKVDPADKYNASWFGSKSAMAIPGEILELVNLDPASGRIEAGIFQKGLLLAADPYTRTPLFRFAIKLQTLCPSGSYNLTSTFLKYLDANQVLQNGKLRIGTFSVSGGIDAPTPKTQPKSTVR